MTLCVFTTTAVLSNHSVLLSHHHSPALCGQIATQGSQTQSIRLLRIPNEHPLIYRPITPVKLSLVTLCPPRGFLDTFGGMKGIPFYLCITDRSVVQSVREYFITCLLCPSRWNRLNVFTFLVYGQFEGMHHYTAW